MPVHGSKAHKGKISESLMLSRNGKSNAQARMPTFVLARVIPSRKRESSVDSSIKTYFPRPVAGFFVSPAIKSKFELPPISPLLKRYPIVMTINHNQEITMKKVFLLLSLVLIALPIVAQDSNLMEGCVAEYDPEVDYFPAKVEITAAENFDVQYFNNYKVLSVSDAFDDAPLFTYVLVQCGTVAPSAEDFPEGTAFVEVPTGNIIVLSSTYLPHLTQLGLLDQLVGLDSFLYTNTPEVVEKIEAGELVEVGSGTDINVEMVLNAEPDIVMAHGFSPDTDAFPVLLDAGIFTALSSDWREATPLGRAEWIKFTALFYNAESTANDVYDAIASNYSEIQTLANSIPGDERPVILWNTYTTYDDAWYIAGSDTYVGAMIHDAGATIALGEDISDGQLMSFETVYESALTADVWVTNAFAVTGLDDLLAQDERYADFVAVQNGAVWNNDLDVNENFGNNYYELGVTNPDLVLADMVAIFHPDLMPDHEFTFFRPLE